MALILKWQASSEGERVERRELKETFSRQKKRSLNKSIFGAWEKETKSLPASCRVLFLGWAVLTFDLKVGAE